MPLTGGEGEGLLTPAKSEVERPMTLIQVNRDLDHFARGVGPHRPNVGSRSARALLASVWPDRAQGRSQALGVHEHAARLSPEGRL